MARRNLYSFSEKRCSLRQKHCCSLTRHNSEVQQCRRHLSLFSAFLLSASELPKQLQFLPVITT